MTNEPTDVFRHYTMTDNCWQWNGTWGGRARDRRPYFQADGRRTLAYRWVWELVNGPIPDDQMILHSCDNGGHPIGCGQPKHMRLGSLQENMDDMKSRDRHGLPKTVRNAIRTLLDQGRPQAEIAQLYGLSREAISAIATGRVYKRDSAPEGRISGTTTSDLSISGSPTNALADDPTDPDKLQSYEGA